MLMWPIPLGWRVEGLQTRLEGFLSNCFTSSPHHIHSSYKTPNPQMQTYLGRSSIQLSVTHYQGSVLYRNISVVSILCLYDTYCIIHFSYTIHCCLTLLFWSLKFPNSNEIDRHWTYQGFWSKTRQNVSLIHIEYHIISVQEKSPVMNQPMIKYFTFV